MGNGEKPRNSGGTLCAIAGRGTECGGEDLGAEVGGDLGVVGGAHEIAQDEPLVASVEDGESFGIGPSGCEQRGVGGIGGRRHTFINGQREKV
jgi:hypothetical protein